MQTIVSVVREILGLFIDDGSLVLCVLIWVACCGFAFPATGIGGALGGFLFFLGLAIILGENTVRGATRQARRKVQ
jgi:hypothetical protein